MKILRIILGILMVCCAMSVLTVPAVSGLVLTWIIPIFLLVTGVFTIVRFIENKNAENIAKKNGTYYVKTDIGSLIFGIVAIALFILARTSIIGSVIFEKVITILYGVWIALNGISLIVCGNGLKKLAQPGWVAMIILGVLLVLSGIACAVNIFVALSTIGILFGISMMMNGFAFMLR